MHDPVILLIILGVGLMFYFMPFLVAAMRGHKNTTAIFFANFFFGWTGIGWCGIFVWAVMR